MTNKVCNFNFSTHVALLLSPTAENSADQSIDGLETGNVYLLCSYLHDLSLLELIGQTIMHKSRLLNRETLIKGF